MRRARPSNLCLLIGGMFVFFLTMQVDLGLPRSLADAGRWGFLLGTAAVGFSMSAPLEVRGAGAVRTWVLFLLTACLATVLVSTSPLTSLLKWIALSCQVFIFVWVAPALMRRTDWARVTSLVRLLLALVLVPSVLGVVLGADVFRGGRLAGLTNANSLGIIGLSLASLSVWGIHPSSPRWTREQARSAVEYGCCVVAVALTGSRSSLAGLFVCTAAWLVFGGARRAIFVALLLGVPAAVLGLEQLFGRLLAPTAALFMRGERLTESREAIWQSAFASWQESPIFGHGYGVSALETEGGLTSAIGTIRDGSGYFGFLESVGLLGGVALLGLYWACGAAFVRLGRDTQAKRPGDSSWLKVMRGGSLVFALALNAVGEPWILGPGSLPHLLFWFGIGLFLVGQAGCLRTRARGHEGHDLHTGPEPALRGDDRRARPSAGGRGPGRLPLPRV